MREIRTYEIDRSDSPKKWYVPACEAVHVTRGVIWITVEGKLVDHWLGAGDSVELDEPAIVWVSSDQDGSQFSLGTVEALRTFHA